MRGLILLALLLFAIGASAPTPPPKLEIQNESQYPLTELRIHEGPIYLESENLLEAPLEIGESLALEYEGPHYLTYFREKYEHGPILAFTTATPIALAPERIYRVTIFDESFRVVVEGGEEPAGCACSAL